MTLTCRVHCIELPRLLQVSCTQTSCFVAVAGSAYNQAGRASGLTAPNGPAQTTLIRCPLWPWVPVVFLPVLDRTFRAAPLCSVLHSSHAQACAGCLPSPFSLSCHAGACRTALRVARLSPQEVGFVSVHGTGTPLGASDPVCCVDFVTPSASCSLHLMFAPFMRRDQQVQLLCCQRTVSVSDRPCGRSF